MEKPLEPTQIVPAEVSVLSVLESRAPAMVRKAGKRAAQRFVEFFTARVRNENTRAAYGKAVGRFVFWCEERKLELVQLEPVHVAAYVEELTRMVSAPSVKQHLAGIRMMLDYLVTGGVLQYNPAAAVRGPKHVVRKGKTPVLTAEEARELLDAIDTSHVVGLRDRALIGVMLFSFARVGAVVRMRVEDYYLQGKRSWLRLHEKGGKHLQVPCHHLAEEYLDGYLAAAGIAEDRKGPLFRTVLRNRRTLTEDGLDERAVLKLVKRRARQAGFAPESVCCHTFRATGITTYLKNGGALETAQTIAGHESARTTGLYDRRQEELSVGEIERIRI